MTDTGVDFIFYFLIGAVRQRKRFKGIQTEKEKKENWLHSQMTKTIHIEKSKGLQKGS